MLKEIKYNDKLSFGIDLGITSVGWSVVDLENKTIVDKGVNLFGEANKAEDTRNARGVRRRLRRRKHRIERLVNLFKASGIQTENTYDGELLNKRLKGLKEKISEQDIVNIIMFFARNRGYIPFNSEDERESELVSSLREKGMTACEIQKYYLDTIGKYRGIDCLVLHSDYMNELNKILDTQSKHYNFITKEFMSEVNEIIDSKRKFWEGPGGPKENQLTKYGRYRNKQDLVEYAMNHNYRKYLFEDLIGTCSVYSTEKKASMGNYYAEEFNFYNDFLNLRVELDPNKINMDNVNKENFYHIHDMKYGLKVSTIEKIQREVLTASKVEYKKILKNLLGVELENFTGYKKDSKDSPEISKYEIFRKIKNKVRADLGEEYVTMIENNIDAYNKAIYYMQVSPDQLTRLEMLQEKVGQIFDEKLIEKLSFIEIENKYHSFSEKALKTYLEFMKKSNENSSYVERKFKEEIASDVLQKQIEKYINKDIKQGDLKYINSVFIEEVIAAPAVKKSLRKAITVLNRLFYKFGYPKYICIENTRELLSENAQKEYESKMLDNTKKRNAAAKALEKEGITVSENNIDKYLLLKEVNNKCMYCNRDITVANCEIEHILPVSITADDSFNNKTVSCTHCNAKKNNQTPYEFLTGENSYESYKEKVLKLKDISQIKKKNLLFEGNLNKYEKEFKNRNLNDTAYATNELANQLKIFKEAYMIHNFGEILETNILKIPGQFTGIIRTKFKIEKDRNENFHHAVDASILASLPLTKLGKLINYIQNDSKSFWKVKLLDEYRGNLFENLFITNELKEELKKADATNTRVCQEVVKKTNGQLFDANIQKVILLDGTYYKIDQIDNIYDSKTDVKKIFAKDKSSKVNKLLCEYNDKPLYNKLLAIIEQYKDVKGNPFIEYCKENNMTEEEIENKVAFNPLKHGIRKTENKKSPVVTKLRFLSKVTTPFILNKKSIANKKEGNMIMYNSLKSYCIRVYRDKETQELYFMPIYRIFVDSKSGEIKTDSEYYKNLYDTFVGRPIESIEKYMDLFNNEYVVFKDKKGNVKEGLISGFHKTHNKVEVKKCSASITKKTAEIKKVKFDALGLYNLNI